MVSDKIQEFLEELYGREIGERNVLVLFTPLELEQLNNLISLGMSERKSHLMKNAKKEKRKLNEWERHLLSADRNLWKKIREAEKLALGEE